MRRLPLLFVVGCGDFVPVEGEWTLVSVEITEDSCTTDDGTLIDPADAGMVYTVTATEGGFQATYTLDQGETIVSDCILDGRSYACGAHVGELPWVEDGTMFITQVDQGEFLSPGEKQSGSRIDVTCAGANCWQVEDMFHVDLPCRSVISGISTANATE